MQVPLAGAFAGGHAAATWVCLPLQDFGGTLDAVGAQRVKKTGADLGSWRSSGFLGSAPHFQAFCNRISTCWIRVAIRVPKGSVCFSLIVGGGLLLGSKFGILFGSFRQIFHSQICHRQIA